MNSGQNEWLSKAEDLADRVSYSKEFWTLGGSKQIYDDSRNVIILCPDSRLHDIWYSENCTELEYMWHIYFDVPNINQKLYQ